MIEYLKKLLDKPGIIFTVLFIAFLIYSSSIYIKPIYSTSQSTLSKEDFAEGRLVWQRYNCQSCHQIYSLGGYLGPDLTNIFSKPGKSESYLKAITITGTKQMPAFQMNDKELKLLMQFLKGCDESGNADMRELETTTFGMTKRK